MTLGVGLLDQSGGDLASLMSAQEDRLLAAATTGVLPEASPALEVNRQLDPSDGVNYAGGSSYSEGMPLLPSSVGLTGVMGAGADLDQREMQESLCGGLAGFGGLFETIGKTDTYLMLMSGKPWPPPLNQGRISAGYVMPTVMSRVSNINKGWNAAAQPGPPPGLNVGYSDKTLGPSTWEEALDYAPSPLADQLGALQGLGAITVGASDPGMRKVLDAASKPGTQETGAVARELIKQSMKLGDLTGKRAAVMQSARKNYTSLLRKVTNIDSETQRIANNLFDADGEPRSSVSVADIRSYRKLRQKGFKLGREAIRYQKTNILATGLTKNGYAQAKLLQDMAMTMMTGRGKTTAILAAQFEMIGKESKGLRAQRELQVARWKAKSAEERVKSLEGLSLGDLAIEKALSADYWEADLAGLEFYEMAYLGALEGIWGTITKPFKKAFKAVKTAAKAVVSVTKATARATVAVARGRFKKAARIAIKAADAKVRRLIARSKKALTKAKKKVVSAAKGVRKFGKGAYKTAKSISKPVWKSMKAVARVAVAPVKASYNVGKHLARGNFRGAANSIARSVKETASNIATAAGSITFGLTCAIDRSPVGKAVAQGVGQAVGTFYGGPVGGAVGNEAGRKANEASRGICNGMDRIGLTRGRIRPSQIGPAFKQTGRFLIKKTFSPKELLKSGINIGLNYATGGSGAGAAATAAAKEAAKRGVIQAATGQAKEFAKAQLQKQIEAEIQRKINQSPELRALSKHTPLIKAAYQNIGAFSGGEVNMDVIKNTLQQQGTAALKRYGPQVAESAVRRVAGRRAGDFVGTTGRVLNMTPAQREAYFRRQAMQQGRQLAMRATREIAGRRAGQIVGGATALIEMTPAQRRAFARRQAATGARQVAQRAVRRVSPQAAVALRRAQQLSRMTPAQRAKLLRQQAIRRGRLAATRRMSPQMVALRGAQMQAARRRTAQNRALARAQAAARQRMGVPGALLRT